MEKRPVEDRDSTKGGHDGHGEPGNTRYAAKGYNDVKHVAGPMSSFSRNRKRWILALVLTAYALFRFLGGSLFELDAAGTSFAVMHYLIQIYSAALTLFFALVSGSPFANITSSNTTAASAVATLVSNPINQSSFPSWQKYVRSPSSSTVYPVSVVSTETLGQVDNPSALLQTGGAVTTLTRDAPPKGPQWPNGTTVEASSTHSGEYYPEYAIDGDPETYWNDNTEGAYPDVLTILPSKPVDLSVLSFVFNADGVPVNFEVSVMVTGSSSWTLVQNVTRNHALSYQVDLPSTLTVSKVRITVTLDEDRMKGRYTRIAEVYPGVAPIVPAPPTVVVDFGMVVTGFLAINFAGASDNSPGIRLAFSETLQYLTGVSDFSRSNNGDTITPGSDQVAVQAKPYVYNNTHGCQHGSQVCSDGLHGFRYVKIYLDAISTDKPYTQDFGIVKIDSVSLAFTPFLGTPDTFTGYFQCSDEELTQYWYDGVYTNDLNLDHFRKDDVDPRDAYTPTLDGKWVLYDGTKRDRDPYVGDLAVAGRTLYASHVQESIAVRNILADLAAHQRADGWIPPASISNYTLPLYDYPLYWVTSSYDYMMYTQDQSYIDECYGNIVNVLDKYYPASTDPNGLLNKTLVGNISDYGDYAFVLRTDVVTYYNALYVLALRNSAELASTYGYPNDAARWTARAALVSKGINENLFDPKVGAFLDYNGTHSQDGNMLSIIANVTDSTRSQSILDYWASLALPYGNPFYDSDALGTNYASLVYPFITYFELEARFLTGNGNSAIEEIRRLYGWMATNDPGITHWEGIGPKGAKYEAGFTSLAHGWSTGVTPILTNHVLGIVSTGSGVSKWLVRPVLVDGITWARGQVPVAQGGAVSVVWSKQDIVWALKMEVSAPTNTTGTVSVPVSSSRVVVFVNGHPAWVGVSLAYSATYADGYVTLDPAHRKPGLADNSGGKWTITVLGCDKVAGMGIYNCSPDDYGS